MRRIKLILAAAMTMAVMMVLSAAPAMADEHYYWGWSDEPYYWGFNDPWYLEDPSGNSDDVEVVDYWGGDWYLVEYEPERVDGEWTWVVDDVEPAWGWWA